MAELTQLELAEGVRALSGTGARGFLGLDPVTQNEPLLAALLTDRGARLFRCGDAVLGYAPNPDNPRQAEIATSSTDPEVLGALTGFLRRYRRFTSFVCFGGPAEALTANGFRHTGRLRGHVFRAGAYHDVDVHVHATTQEQMPCG